MSAGITDTIGQPLELAGRSPALYGATVLGDRLFHVLVFVTIATVFAVIRPRWPVRASLLPVAGAWQAIVASTKVLYELFTFPVLGQAYLAADAASRPLLLTVANAANGLAQALQWMDSVGVLAILVLVALLPAVARIPRPVRWLGWIMSLALLVPAPSFLLVVLLMPVWMVLVGRWLGRLAPAA